MKKNIYSKILIVLIIILITSCTTAYAVTQVYSNLVTYDNSSSGLNSTNVQEAIDELYNSCNNANNSNGNTLFFVRTGIIYKATKNTSDSYWTVSEPKYTKSSAERSICSSDANNTNQCSSVSVVDENTIFLIRNGFLYKATKNASDSYWTVTELLFKYNSSRVLNVCAISPNYTNECSSVSMVDENTIYLIKHSDLYKATKNTSDSYWTVSEINYTKNSAYYNVCTANSSSSSDCTDMSN